MKDHLKGTVQKHISGYFKNHVTYTGEVVKRELGVALKEALEHDGIKELDLEKPEGFYLKKGDVILVQKGEKWRPAVIFKVMKDKVFSIPLTTSPCIHNIDIPYKSRFFRSGYYTNGIEVTEIGLAEKYFKGPLEDTRSLNKAIVALKEFYRNVL